ncbi:MAG: hypothetical protein ACXIUP_03040 [Microcella sp.]
MSPHRRAWLITGIVALLFGLGALAVWLGMSMTGGTPVAEPSAEPPSSEPAEPSTRPVPSDTGAASPTTAPEPARAELPADCASLYSPAMTAELQSFGVVLNPAWTVSEPNAGLAFADEQLETWTAEWDSRQCIWTTEGGGSGIGLETHVVPLIPEEEALVGERLASLGYSSADELGGTRYFWSVTDDEFGGAYGESHIVVGGYWFATAWLDLGVTGYTADMVQNLVGVD